MTPTYASQVAPGERAMLQGTAARTRASALSLDRRPVDASDAKRRETMAASAERDRIVVRSRTIYRHQGLRIVPTVVYDVLRVAGLGPTARDLELIASGCPWEQEAVCIAKDALAGRTFVALGGTRTGFTRGAGFATPDRSLMRPDVPTTLIRESPTQMEVRLPPPPQARPDRP